MHDKFRIPKFRTSSQPTHTPLHRIFSKSWCNNTDLRSLIAAVEQELRRRETSSLCHLSRKCHLHKTPACSWAWHDQKILANERWKTGDLWHLKKARWEPGGVFCTGAFADEIIDLQHFTGTEFTRKLWGGTNFVWCAFYCGCYTNVILWFAFRWRHHVHSLVNVHVLKNWQNGRQIVKMIYFQIKEHNYQQSW